MQVGDFVKGLPGTPYSITTEDMTRGVVTSVYGDRMSVKVLDHAKDMRGTFDVDKRYFEVIGHAKPFVRKDVMELLKSGCKKALLDYDLHRANLSRADLRGTNLREANLRGADLSGADLSGADLSEANLSEADLREANLSEADLREANLRGANLRGADLHRANLSRADLRGPNLRVADLSRADLRGTNLSGADLSEANLSGADLRGADLREADLREADLREADLDFSCFPLWCGGLHIKTDVRLAAQVAYHLCTMQCDDAEYIAMRNSILEFANKFHRVTECGILTPIDGGGENVNLL